MKYIKIFEDVFDSNLYDSCRHWLMSTDERFEDSLRQIKCSENRIKGFLSNRSINSKYIFIGYNPNRGNVEDDKWGWTEYEDNLTDNFYEINNYKFMGTVNMNEY